VLNPGPAALALQLHALAPIANLSVRDVLATTRLTGELTLGLGTVVHDDPV
jgi:acetoacetate decarboxylase